MTLVVTVPVLARMAMLCRGVARGGGAEGGQSPPEFGRSVNPIQTIGADYARHTTASSTGFKMLSTLGLIYTSALLVPALKNPLQELKKNVFRVHMNS